MLKYHYQLCQWHQCRQCLWLDWKSENGQVLRGEIGPFIAILSLIYVAVFAQCTILTDFKFLDVLLSSKVLLRSLQLWCFNSTGAAKWYQGHLTSSVVFVLSTWPLQWKWNESQLSVLERLKPYMCTEHIPCQMAS